MKNSMPKKGGMLNPVMSHPYAVTYALSFLLTLSLLALIVVVVNCSNRTVLIDGNTGEVLSGSEQLY